uniref:Ribosomal protein L2 n=1 Tax=Heterosigma akashiwo TaxID=2829 RepID=A0A2Z5W7Z1_HETAK|nr:ribosomal protein L2 [Heterosigma akashiwo]
MRIIFKIENSTNVPSSIWVIFNLFDNSLSKLSIKINFSVQFFVTSTFLKGGDSALIISTASIFFEMCVRL